MALTAIKAIFGVASIVVGERCCLSIPCLSGRRDPELSLEIDAMSSILPVDRTQRNWPACNKSIRRASTHQLILPS